jgi:hypothetical protein
MTDEERAAVAAELRKIREAAHEEELRVRTAAEILPPTRPIDTAAPAHPLVEEPPAPPAVRPDNAAVNELWSLPGAGAPAGFRGALFRLLRRALAPLVESQVAFNSRQVQLDNQIIEYLEARLAVTHRHYDHVLGQYGERLNDADERHRILERELVAHVHDLVKRIDLVLDHGERGRLSLEVALRDVRARLVRLEERLGL